MEIELSFSQGVLMLRHTIVVALVLLIMLPSVSSAGITSVTKNNDLQFGRFISLASSGTVTVNAAGARSSAGGITLLNGGTVVAAAYTVTGSNNSNYTITLPANNTVVIRSAGLTLTLTSFTCSKPLTGKLGSGTTTMIFTVGATAKVTPNATPGTYSGSFNVTAN